MTFDEVCVTCATKTGMTRAEWSDFLQLEPAAQAAVAQAYRDQSWTQDANLFAEILAILIVAGSVAGAVSGIAGAVTALQALRV